jgi:uncharacterized YigZ family protein
MSETDFYFTIERSATAEFKDRGSKFIAYAWPIASTDDFKKQMEAVKKEHPKASHHCFAYRMGLDKSIYRVSDAGEPSGTAGKPILGQIDSKQLTNLLVVVVRYFGGTLLGVPGLINAYKSAASMVLQVTPVVQKPVEVNYRIQFDYTVVNEVMMVIKQCNCTIISQEMQLFCNISVGISKSRLDETLFRLKDIKGIEIEKLS